jgi:hypothetical protein
MEGQVQEMRLQTHEKYSHPFFKMALSLASSDIGMKLAQYLSVKQIISAMKMYTKFMATKRMADLYSKRKLEITTILCFGHRHLP